MHKISVTFDIVCPHNRVNVNQLELHTFYAVRKEAMRVGGRIDKFKFSENIINSKSEVEALNKPHVAMLMDAESVSIDIKLNTADIPDSFFTEFSKLINQ